MTSEKNVVLRVMRLFNAEFPDRFKLNDERRRVWEHLLAGFDGDVVLAAAMHMVSERREHPPNIGAFRSLVVGMAHGEIAPPSSSEAWGHVLERLQGRDTPLTPLEAAALKKIGSIYDLKTSGNLAADRAQFKKAFEDLVRERDTERNMLPMVRGVLEARTPQLPAPPSRELPAPAPSAAEVDPDFIADLVAKAMRPIETICADYEKDDN